MPTPKRTIRLSDEVWAWCQKNGGAAKIVKAQYMDAAFEASESYRHRQYVAAIRRTVSASAVPPDENLRIQHEYNKSHMPSVGDLVICMTNGGVFQVFAIDGPGDIVVKDAALWFSEPFPIYMGTWRKLNDPPAERTLEP